jgi:hypothetical protein
MASHRHDPEVRVLVRLLEAAAAAQPDGRRPSPAVVSTEVQAELDRWQMLARANNDADRFVYAEPSSLRVPQRDVVLGDDQHRANNLAQVYEDAPQSLRDVEPTTTLKG